ncbi:MAG: phage tail terminator-like protein [Spongiibacteraceae bacterium]
MNLNAERIAIVTRMSGNWASTYKGDTVPVKYEEAPNWTTPNRKAWVALTTKIASNTSWGLCGDEITERVDGVIYIQVFVPDNEGTSAARSLAEDAAAVFENARFDGIKTFAATPTIVGNDGNGWYQITVSIPYHRYAQKQNTL